MKVLKLIMGIILLPISIFVWYRVFQLIRLELNGSHSPYESSVSLSGVNQFTKQMEGSAGWSFAIIVLLLLAIVFILRNGRKKL